VETRPGTFKWGERAGAKLKLYDIFRFVVRRVLHLIALSHCRDMAWERRKNQNY